MTKEATTVREGREDTKSLATAVWILTVLMVVLYVGAAVFFARLSGEESPWLVVSLFALPSFPAFFFLRIFLERFPKNLPAFIPLGSIFFQACCLVLYTFRERCAEQLQLFAWLSFGLATLLVLLPFFLTPSFLDRERSRGLGRWLRRWLKIDSGFIRRYPFATLSFFLAVLCFTAYFLAFALAFHDQGLKLAATPGQPGLYSRPMIWTLAEWAKQERDRANDDERLAPLSSIQRVQFQRGVTTVDTDIEYERRRFEGNHRGADILIGEVSEDRQRQLRNSEVLCEIVDTLLRYRERSQVRVVLVGHADGTSVAENRHSYRSNFEVSQSRIHNVMVEIIRRVQERGWDGNIEWITIPLSDDRSFLDVSSRTEDDLEESQLSVEVAVFPAPVTGPPRGPILERSRAFSLLDYVYFAVYTISTTGYGDIIPISSFTKFVSAVANIFEVVFIVIFFNVLTSFLTDLRRESGSQSGARQTTGGHAE